MVEKDKVSVSDLTQKIVKEADVLYEFVLKYAVSMNISKDYGTGDKLNMIEAHLLTYIEDHPGITGTELAKMWGRTKGAISQQMKKLVSRGLIVRKRQSNNAKTILLYVSDKGKEVSYAHKMHDMKEIAQTLTFLLTTCSLDEIASFYKVMRAYIIMLDEN